MLPSEVLKARRGRILRIASDAGATNVRVFGSVARGQDRADSDIDLLVDVPPGTSLLRIVGLQLAIADALGVSVDVCTERELDPELKPGILAEARPL